MEVRIIQNSIGRYNLLSNEDCFVYSVGIFNDGKICREGDIKAIAEFTGDPEDVDMLYWDDVERELEFIVEACIRKAKHTFGTTDYKAQCKLFAKLFCENFDEIQDNWDNAKRYKIKKNIEQLTRKLNKPYFLADCREEVRDIVLRDLGEDVWPEPTEAHDE